MTTVGAGCGVGVLAAVGGTGSRVGDAPAAVFWDEASPPPPQAAANRATMAALASSKTCSRDDRLKYFNVLP